MHGIHIIDLSNRSAKLRPTTPSFRTWHQLLSAGNPEGGAKHRDSTEQTTMHVKRNTRVWTAFLYLPKTGRCGRTLEFPKYKASAYTQS